MAKLALKYLSIVLSIYVVSMAVGAVYVRNASAILVMGLVLLVVNLLLKPVLLIVALPLNILTLGLFSFVVNALTIMLADSLVPGIDMGGFLNCLLAALMIAVFNSLLIDMNKPGGRRERE